MNVAIIGCGGMGSLHAQMGNYGAEATEDCMGILKRADVDIVAITTPTPTHSMYVVAAAQAGKNIFCEKPFGRTVEQAKEALAAAKKAKVKLFVGHVVRYFQEFDAMRSQILAGKVGKPGFAKVYRGGIYPWGEDSWFRDYEKSGGVAFGSVIHDLDWVRYVFGEVDHVFCQALQRSEPDYIDYGQVTLRMKSGMIAKVVGTWAHPSGFRVEAEICGDKGVIQFNSDESPFSTMRRAKPGEPPGMIVPGSPVPISPYQLEWQDFISWINGGPKPRVMAEDGVQAVRIADAALRSAKTGKPVKL